MNNRTEIVLKFSLKMIKTQKPPQFLTSFATPDPYASPTKVLIQYYMVLGYGYTFCWRYQCFIIILASASDSLVNILPQTDKSDSPFGTTTNITLTSATIPITQTNSQLDEKSSWDNYRFLLLPGSLAFLTLVGMQIVVCTFWLPRSVKQYFRCCRRKTHRHEKLDESKNGRKGESNLITLSKPYKSAVLVNRSVGSACVQLAGRVTADRQMSDDIGTRSMTALLPSPCLPYSRQSLPNANNPNECSSRRNISAASSNQLICTNGELPGRMFPIDYKNSHSSDPKIPAASSSIFYMPDPIKSTLACYNPNLSVQSTVLIPYVPSLVQCDSRNLGKKPVPGSLETRTVFLQTAHANVEHHPWCLRMFENRNWRTVYFSDFGTCTNVITCVLQFFTVISNQKYNVDRWYSPLGHFLCLYCVWFVVHISSR